MTGLSRLVVVVAIAVCLFHRSVRYVAFTRRCTGYIGNMLCSPEVYHLQNSWECYSMIKGKSGDHNLGYIEQSTRERLWLSGVALIPRRTFQRRHARRRRWNVRRGTEQRGTVPRGNVQRGIVSSPLRLDRFLNRCNWLLCYRSAVSHGAPVTPERRWRCTVWDSND